MKLYERDGVHKHLVVTISNNDRYKSWPKQKKGNVHGKQHVRDSFALVSTIELGQSLCLQRGGQLFYILFSDQMSFV